MANNFNGGMELSVEEREIIETLKRVGDELDNDPRIDRIIRGVATGSLAELSYSVFTQLIREFVDLVVGSTKVSAKMVEKIVRIFILMWRGPALSGKVLQELYPGTSVDNAENDMSDDMSVYIPQEINLMEDEFIKKYQEFLKNGQQSVKSIRLMIVGMFGIGKTSLVENLIDRDDISQRKIIESTVGIDVTHCKIRDGKWIEDIFDNNLGDRVLDVMHNPQSSAFSYDTIDEVDSGILRSASVEDKKDEVENIDIAEILYEPIDTIEKHDLEPQSNTESYEETEELTKKLNQSEKDDPDLYKFVQTIKSAVKPNSPLDSTISIWDFAGQYIYYSTHHFFLNSRSIYLLMMDISNPLTNMVKEESNFPLSGFIPKDFTCLEAFKFWLNSIHMYSTQVGKDIQPSVILVGTKKDKLEGTDKDKETLKDNYFDEALKSLNESPALKLVHRKKFLISNLDKENEDFRKIREEVECLARKQNYWGEHQPAKWISLERKFLGLKSEGNEIITFDDVKKVNKQIEMPIDDEDELRFFLRFQHSLGNILYYETALLKKHVILSPQWIIDAFRCFITHVKDKDPQQLKDWENYEKKAILTQELIDEIIDNTEVNKYFRDYKKQVIEYMEHLDMIAKPIDAAICEEEENTTSKIENQGESMNWNASGEDHQTCAFTEKSIGLRKETDQHWIEDSGDLSKDSVQKGSSATAHFYIVPCLLKLRPELREIPQLTNPPHCKTKTPILCFKFINKFMPPSVFHRLLAVCIRQWTIRNNNKCSLLFNGFAVFNVTETKATTLSIWFQDYIIYARVSFYREVDKSLAQEIRSFLVRHLNGILRILPKESRITEEMPFEEYIQCSRIEEFEADTGLLRIRDLFVQNWGMCEHCNQVVEKDDGIGLWCYNSIQKQRTSTIPPELLQKQPTVKELARISWAIGGEYSILRKVLDIQPAVLEQIEDVFRFHLPTKVYHMLCKWNNCDRTIEQLRNALIAVDSDIDCFDNIIQNDPFQSIKLNTLEGVDFNRKPNDEELALLKDKIGHEYWLLGVELGIEEVRLEHLREDTQNIVQMAYAMLREWNDGDSSIEYLGKAMHLAKSNITAFYEVFTK